VWRRRTERATLDDVVEYLQGIATTLMVVSAKVEAIAEALGGDADDEANP